MLNVELREIYPTRSFEESKFESERPSLFTVKEEGEEEFSYSNPVQYWFLLVGYAVGYGSFWRFPYLIYTCGGGAFLVPYFLFLFLVGIPLFFLESAVGQLLKNGPVELYSKIKKQFEGIGWAMISMTWMTSVYYGIILCWSIGFLFYSFISPLPWAVINLSPAEEMTNLQVIRNEDGSVLLNKGFFREQFLQVSEGIENMGSLNMYLFFCLICTCLLVYFCIYQGVKTSSYVVYVTGPAPVVILTFLMFKGFALPGSMDGLVYLFYPRFSKLMDFGIWVKAATQVMYALGIGFGGNILFASYRNQTDNVYHSSIYIPLITVGCGFLSAIINFSFLGHLSYLTKIGIDDLPLAGTDLAFITYPSILNLLPWPNLWSVVFFLMLITLGIDSQFAFIETVGVYVNKFFFKGANISLANLSVIIASFVFAIPLVMNGGFYYFALIDGAICLVSCTLILFLESYVIAKYFGFDLINQLASNKTGFTIPYYISLSWNYLSPCMLIGFIVLAILDKINNPPSYKVLWPYFAEAFVAFFPVSNIIYYFVKYKEENENEFNQANTKLMAKEEEGRE